MAPNAFVCSAHAQVALNQFNDTQLFIAANPQLQRDEVVFRMTKIVSNSTANAVDECYNTTLGLRAFMQSKRALFNSSSTFMLGFLQTQIGNIITYNNIYQSILQAKDKN